ncbi:hypothetical protein ILYODFUR_038038 [Ilyodon furcidens]|uniref:Uncharacterized protein n=1 Tax=Ilyodon furcidens TaxID=33524 RepID=A0ABV0T3M3_9TELE
MLELGYLDAGFLDVGLTSGAQQPVTTNIHIPHNASGVWVDTDDPPKLKVTSQCILITQPNNVSDCDISLCGVPFTSDKEIRSSKLAPGPPKLVNLVLHFLKSFIGITCEVKTFPLDDACPNRSELGVIYCTVSSWL